MSQNLKRVYIAQYVPDMNLIYHVIILPLHSICRCRRSRSIFNSIMKNKEKKSKNGDYFKARK
jgi:hypothetical protein